MHMVTCIYCQNKFDRDKIAFEKPYGENSRRYAHKECYEKFSNKKSQNEKDYEELSDYIKQLFGKDYLTARISKQIRDYRADFNYSFSGMLQSLKYWYEIKKHSIKESNKGVGIIPYIYEEAKAYYENIYLAQQYNDNFDFTYKVRRVEIGIPKARTYGEEKKLFNLE